MKTCVAKDCKQMNPQCLDNFYKDKRTTDGLMGRCKKCHGSLCREWEDNNRDKVNVYAQKSRDKDRTKLNQRRRNWRNNRKDIENQRYKKWKAANPLKIKESIKKSRQKHSDKVNALNNKRRCQRLNATPKWLTQNDFNRIETFYTQAKELSEKTGIKYHVDHIVPLLR